MRSWGRVRPCGGGRRDAAGGEGQRRRVPRLLPRRRHRLAPRRAEDACRGAGGRRQRPGGPPPVKRFNNSNMVSPHFPRWLLTPWLSGVPRSGRPLAAAGRDSQDGCFIVEGSDFRVEGLRHRHLLAGTA